MQKYGKGKIAVLPCIVMDCLTPRKWTNEQLNEILRIVKHRILMASQESQSNQEASHIPPVTSHNGLYFTQHFSQETSHFPPVTSHQGLLSSPFPQTSFALYITT